MHHDIGLDTCILLSFPVVHYDLEGDLPTAPFVEAPQHCSKRSLTNHLACRVCFFFFLTKRVGVCVSTRRRRERERERERCAQAKR